MKFTTFFAERNIVELAFPDIPQFAFDFRATAYTIVVEGDGNVFWSFDQRNIEGRISPDDVSITFDNIGVSKIYMKTDVPISAPKKPSVRIWAWHVKS